MGTIDLRFAVELRDALGLRRVVETGTYRGLTARALAPLFESVTTIELSPTIHARAAARLAEHPNVSALRGHSVEVLAGLARDDGSTLEKPTLYFLDGHWSGGHTAGVEEQCPVLDEIAAIGSGHGHDCLIVDDARLFTSAPPPPHDPAQWPALTDVFDAIRARHPDHAVTLLDDQVIAVPASARPALDAYGARIRAASVGLPQWALGVLAGARDRLRGPMGRTPLPPARAR